MNKAEQRIVSVLHSRGREATVSQVRAWVNKMRLRFYDGSSVRPDYSSFAEALADAIDDGNKTWTTCLHIHFGDAL
jgi:hypothetical protein